MLYSAKLNHAHKLIKHTDIKINQSQSTNMIFSRKPQFHTYKQTVRYESNANK